MRVRQNASPPRWCREEPVQGLEIALVHPRVAIEANQRRLQAILVGKQLQPEVQAKLARQADAFTWRQLVAR